MSRDYTSARYSPQLLPRCGQVWALCFLLLVLPHSAVWGVLFLFPEEKTDPENDIEITELRNGGIRILTQKGPCPPALMGLPLFTVLPFPEVDVRLVQSSVAHICPHLPTSHLHLPSFLPPLY